jgi:NAD(P)-dependent dehydrogenase (short-subunit alcohol dehydrogenase family)
MQAPAVVLITGSARGLGLACARKFLAQGAHVHAVYRTRTAQTDELAREFGPRLHRADALNEAELARVVADVLARDGRLDCAVHAVGEFETGTLEALAPANFRRMFASNTESAFLFARAVLPALRSSRGQLIFFGAAGIESLRARREAAAYMAAKTALLVFAKSLALEEAPAGVRVNLVSPGIIAHADADPDTIAKLEQGRVPLSGRPGVPEDVAAAVIWLCSREARLITGANLDVAGGFGL